ncbi:MAG: PilZ domain-containing protein [Syntrophaceae bacterium]|nr:PilZ domain-containing protein [Syntrophaceae bacterium]
MSLKRKSTVVHRGKVVTIHDYVGTKQEELVPTIKLLTEDITKGKDRDILLLIDFTGCTASTDVVMQFKKSAVEVKPFVHKIVAAGIKGMQAFLLSTINKFAAIQVDHYPTREEALNHITEERRRTPRINEKNDITITVVGENDFTKEMLINSYTENISEGGAKIHTSILLPVDTSIEIGFTSKSIQQQINALGKVKWVRVIIDDESYHAGVEFFGPPGKAIKKLGEYITWKQKSQG